MKNKSEEERTNVNINWYPGHMAKAKQSLTNSLKLVDAIIEVLDARIPLSSRNPDLSFIINGKPSLILLNKYDLADDVCTKNWVNFFNSNGLNCISFSIKDNKSVGAFKNSIHKILKQKIKHWNSLKMTGRSLKLMIVGIPNVGKSSVINRLMNNKKAKAENKAGITKKTQWFNVGNDIQILDTPGILWPKLGDEAVAVNLALVGSIKDEILDIESLALRFIDRIKERYSEKFCDRFKIEKSDFINSDAFSILEKVAVKRGFKMHGNEPDILRASNLIINEFRNGKIGKITLEEPNT